MTKVFVELPPPLHTEVSILGGTNSLHSKTVDEREKTLANNDIFTLLYYSIFLKTYYNLAMIKKLILPYLEIL